MNNKSKVLVYLLDKETNTKSKPVTIEDLIFNQNDIEFQFEDDTTLPYKDFLFFQDDYEVIVRIKENK